MMISCDDIIRPETYTFTLLVGKVTVILEDVTHTYGLPIDGAVVTGWTDNNHDFLVNHSLTIFATNPLCYIFDLLGTMLFADKLSHQTGAQLCFLHVAYLFLSVEWQIQSK
ncbi:hypothetical protein Ahy_B03g062296 [Arachis hypogaea]|uniref:Uncharacterized protein n=1 Tax=Arachis hypogaea TaxID=3818 RepID=A0A444ZTS5_ARAHY|nr:hypothetical protein Ahy_B03g062296 [Arachis hypogaea]